VHAAEEGTTIAVTALELAVEGRVAWRAVQDGDPSASAKGRDRLGEVTARPVEAAAGWASLRRWAQTAPRLWPRSPPLARQGPWRATALAAVAFLASFAPLPTGRVTDDAVVGAAHFPGCPPHPGGDRAPPHHP